MKISTTALIMGLALLTMPLTVSAQSPAPVDLGAAASFGVLAGSTVTSTGATAIVGDLGLSPGSAIDGFPPGTVTGSIYINTPESVAGQADLTTAYNDAAGRSTNPITVAGNIGGQTLPPGLYKSQTSLAISSGDLTLDAQGDQNAVWIFQVGSTFTTTSGRQVILSGGAEAANVFWQVGTSATIGTTSAFVGTIMADQSITIETGASLNGRALARIGAVTLDGNAVTVPSNVTPPPAADVTLALPDTTADANVAISIPVTTNDIDGKDVFSYDFTVTYDANVITLDGVEAMGTLSENATVTVNATNGSIRVMGSSTTAFAGSGVLINLTGMSIVEGLSELTFANVTMNSGDPNGIGMDGSIEVLATPPPVADVTLVLPDTTADANVAISIPVTTNDIDGKDVFSYDFTVTYDPNIVTLDGVETVGTLSDNATVTVTATNGSIRVEGTSTTAFSGSGVLINLTGMSSTDGLSDLTFASVTMNSGDPNGIGIDGSIEVLAAPPPVEVVTLVLPDTTAGANMDISIPITTNDIDGKGVSSFYVTVEFDPNVITLFGVETIGTLSEGAAVTVNTTDGAIHISGMRTTDYSGSGVLIYLTGTSSSSGTSNLTFANVFFNDGAPDGVGVDGSIQLVPGAPAPEVTLTLPRTGTEPNVAISLPVLTRDVEGKNVTAYDFTVSYDPSVIMLDSVWTTGTLSEDATVTVNSSVGSIRVTGSRSHTFSQSGVLVYLTGTSSASGSSDLMFTNVTINNGSIIGNGVDGNILVTVGVANEESGDLPASFALQGNYPNPFNPSTTISFDLPETAEVSVGIFDILGRQVMTVPSSTIQAGSNRGLRIDASSLTSGMYLYRVMATSATRTHIMSGRMSLMK